MVNQYARVVRQQGSPQALRAVNEVFVPRERSLWRGLGEIAEAGVRLIARELGLPLPAAPSANDDAAAGYNALAADPAPLENDARANDN